MKQYIMSIDQGTTSTRAILFDHDSNVVGVAQKELDNFYPQPGWVEQDAKEIWGSTVAVMFEVMAKYNMSPDQIAAIGITNQRETTIVWDKITGEPIYFAIVWQSRQSDEYCEELKLQGKESIIREKTGLLLDPYFSASKIRWILDHVDGAQERAERGELLCGTVDTWLVWNMSNRLCHITDVSNASRMMLMNLKTLKYDQELLDLWNIPACMLPEIVDTSAVYGDCTLFQQPIPIASVVGDQQAALFGQTCFQAGDVKNTYGTGCFLLMNTKDKIIHSTHGLVTCVGWRINNEVDYVMEGSVFVAGAAIQWLRDGLKIIQSSNETQQRALLQEDSDGVYVVPAFTGLGAPYWIPQAKGAMFGLTRGTTQEHIIRATLESLAYQTLDVLEAMQEDSGMQIKSLQVDGGASRNDFLLQFQSDILNAQVRRSLISETTALGAAYLAGLAVGFWKDKEEIKRYFQYGTSFTSNMEDSIRQHKIEGWMKAVQSTINFQ